MESVLKAKFDFKKYRGCFKSMFVKVLLYNKPLIT